MNTRRMVVLLILITLLTLILASCLSGPWVMDVYPTYTPAPFYTPLPFFDIKQEAEYAGSQATLAAGQNEIADLAYQATLVSLDMAQAAKLAAQTTLDYNQRRLMELSIQGTAVSQNMAQAAATQQFFADHTQAIWNATAAAQSQASTATYDAYNLHVTQTAQVQSLLDVQSTQVAQSSADKRAYELTTTPWAAAQAEIAQINDESARQSWWKDFVFTPLRAILFTTIILLVILGGAVAYWRLMPVLELHLRTLTYTNNNPVVLLEGTSVDAASYTPQSQLLNEINPTVEVVGPTEPSVVNWITEAEQKLRANGGTQP